MPQLTDPDARHDHDHEIETLAEFDAAGALGALGGYRVQAVDLTARTPDLLAVATSGAVFLGCPMHPDGLAKVRADGAFVFPPVPDLPFDPYRGLLYTADTLFEHLEQGYDATPDALAYTWFQRTKADGEHVRLDAPLHPRRRRLGRPRRTPRRRPRHRRHGGHAMARGTTAYAGAARLGRTLARSGVTVATGGGPGAMEAANLGAYLAPLQDDAVLDDALQLLAKVPSFAPSITDWARTAFEIRDRWPSGGDSIGIPTWFYGHEPPNAFAGHIAKYFANATREDGLLARCNAGVVFLPGAAGTVQEIFDNATPNYYESRGEPTPMVLVNRAHWTERLPAWPLLQSLAEGRPMESRIALVDTVDQAPAALARLTAE